jgi:hypothetical protein
MARKPGSVPSAPQHANLEDLLDRPQPVDSSGESPAPQAPRDAPEPPPEPAPEPFVRLPAEAFSDLVAAPTASFSDEPPEGWGTGQGNVQVQDYASSQSLDPVAAARASLLEDAARATGGSAVHAPTTPVPVTPRGSRAPDIRMALARAAALPNSTRYRSRVTVGAAWQYDGQLHLAPDWVSREWAAYDNGPAIEVPEVGLVRKGQWIVSQDVLGDDGTVAFSEIKVYPDDVFRSLFMLESPHAPADAAA